MLYAACFLRLLLAPYRAFLTRNRCLGETMLFCARRAPGLRPRRPRPACGRAGVPPSPRISARSLLPPIPPYSAAAFFAAAGPSAAPAGPPPACGRAGVPPSPRISARSLCAQAKPCRAAAFFAAAGPSAAPAGPPPALRPPQAPVSGRFGRGCHRPQLFCLLSHLSRRRCGIVPLAELLRLPS